MKRAGGGDKLRKVARENDYSYTCTCSIYRWQYSIVSVTKACWFVFRKRRPTMIRLLGMRLMTRLLLVVCSLSLVSILFLSRCGLNTLEPETEEQEAAPAQAELPGNVTPLISPDTFRFSSAQIAAICYLSKSIRRFEVGLYRCAVNIICR